MLNILLAKLLASHWKNIAVVGDADQSIYAWRGADIQNILDFERIIQIAHPSSWNKTTVLQRLFLMQPMQ